MPTNSTSLQELAGDAGNGQGSAEENVAAERAILRQRAQEFARPPLANATSPVAEHVILRIADQRFAIDTAHVREAITKREITPLPGTPATIRGIVAVRGRIVAVVDLRALLGSGPADGDVATKLVVLEHRGLEFAVEVDELLIPPSGAMTETPMPLSPGGPDPKFLRSVYPNGVITLDLDTISSALVVNEEI